MELVDDDVANWYVRQLRSRLWAKDNIFDDDTNAAFATLHEVLVVVSRLLAPFTPFMSDQLHRELAGTSVHLAPFVRDAGSRYRDEELEPEMRMIRALATLGRAAREQVGINVRQPLSRLVCVAPGVRHGRLRELLPVLRTELNLQHVELVSSGDSLVTLATNT